jgi:hypothetical protein
VEIQAENESRTTLQTAMQVKQGIKDLKEKLAKMKE